MGRRIKQRLPLLIIYLILVVGIGVMGYPVASNWLSVYTASVSIADYDKVVEEKDTSDLDAMMEEARRYNDALSGKGSKVSVAKYDDLLAATEAIGYLEIPKIGVYMPIYHGVSDEVLAKGIGHIEETSLPVGGESTHSVLSGHTGLPAAKILTELDKMEEEDLFYIHVLNQVLAYKVDQIKTVLPEETDDIQIIEGEDHVTLLTCTPYGINTHRLLVRGARTEYVPEEVGVHSPGVIQVGNDILSVETLAKIAAAVVGAVVLAGILLILLLPGKRSKR